MTINKVDDMLAYLLKLYPNFEMPSEEGLRIWQRRLKNVGEKEAAMAIEDHYASSRFYPHLSDILDGVKKEKLKSLPSEDVAWSQALEAAKGNALKLHTAVKKAIDLFGGLQQMEKGNPQFMRNDFVRAYREVIDGYLDIGVIALDPPKEVIDYGALALERLKKEQEGEL